MSNPVSVINLNDTEAVFLARTNQFGEANSVLIQPKRNKKPGDGTLSPGFAATESKSRTLAQWFDMVDDFVLEWFRTGGGGIVPLTPPAVQTVDATPTIVDTVPLPADKVTRVTWRIVGRETGQEDNAIYAQWTNRYIDDAGVSALWDIESFTPRDASPLSTLAVTVTTAVALNGNDVELTVIGEVGVNIDWEIKRIVEDFF